MRILILFAVAVCAFGQGVNFYSIEKEIALGQSMAAAAGATPFSSPTVQQYIEKLGSRLLAQLPDSAPEFPYTFRMISDDWDTGTHEPSAFPGGIILVPTRLILAAQDEAELAGMLAHAIAHVARRHYTRQDTRGQIATQASVPLIYMGGWQGYGMRQASQVAMPLGYITFARGFEIDADKEAVRILAAAGYDPSALPRYVERTQTDPRSTQFSPMPTRAQRLEAMRAAIGQPSLDQIQELVRGVN